MATRLSIYNDACLLVGERALSSLTEEVETRRLLDQVYDNRGFRKCLAAGQWVFAMRAVAIDYDVAVDPGFGYQRAFEKPTDWELTSGVWSDEYLETPLTRYADEAGYWYADPDTIYVKYVSNDAAYGLDIANWPTEFEEYVSAYFAQKIAKKVGGLAMYKEATFELEQAERKAKNNNAMASPTKFPARGSWTRSRQQYRGGDRGNGGQLIG